MTVDFLTLKKEQDDIQVTTTAGPGSGETARGSFLDEGHKSPLAQVLH